VISPIGRLTRKIQRPAHRDQNPADERPERRRDAAGSRPRPYGAAPALRGKADNSSPCDVGVISASAAACTTRKTTSISVWVAAAHAAEAAVKAPIPTRKLTLRG
jgi:hypothetical protein